MKVRVTYTITVDDDYRRAIRNHYGEPGLATREQVAAWARAYGSSGDDDLMWDLSQKEKRESEGEES